MEIAEHYLQEARRQLRGHKRTGEAALAQLKDKEFFSVSIWNQTLLPSWSNILPGACVLVLQTSSLRTLRSPIAFVIRSLN
jgi:hypothetical protein